MSARLLRFVSTALLGQLEELRQEARTKAAARRDAFSLAAVAFTAVSGNEREVGGFRRLSSYETAWAWSFFHAVATAVAAEMLEAHAELADEVLDHPFLRGWQGAGPFRRLPRDRQAHKGLSALLASPPLFAEYRRRGLLAQDDGSAAGALCAFYLWWQAVRKRGTLQRTAAEIHREGRLLLEEVGEAHPNNPRLRLLLGITRLAWFRRRGEEHEAAREELEAMSQQRGRTAEKRSLALLATSALVSAGIRFQEPDRASAALDRLQASLVPDQPDHPQIRLNRAWIHTAAGETDIARREALAAAESGDSLLRGRAAEVLLRLGDWKAARQLLADLDLAVAPGVAGASP